MAAFSEEKNTTDWRRMTRCPVKLFANPIVLSTNEIIISPYGKNEYLRRYDIEKNKFTTYIPYPTEINIKFHTIACDREKGKIYLYDGCDKVFIEFDIAKQLVTKCKKKKQSIVGNGKFSTSLVYRSTFHVIGGTEKDRHLIWDTMKQKFAEHEMMEPSPAGHCSILLSRNNIAPQIVVFGGNENVKFKKYLDTIYICDIHPEIQWKRLKTFKMPYKQYYFGCIQYKETYVIIFGGKQKDPNHNKKINDGLSDEIWILTLSNWKWKRSHLKCPKKAKYYAVKTDQDMVHLFEYEGNGGHWCMSIAQLISHTVVRRESLEKQVQNLADRLTEMNEENVELQDVQRDHKHKVKTLKYRNRELLQENEELKKEIEALKKLRDNDDNMQIQKSLLKAKEDYKRLDVKYKQLRTMKQNGAANIANPFDIGDGKQQNANGNPFEDDYAFWSYSDILQWIAKVESGKYRQYMSVLKNTLKQRNVDGHTFVNFKLIDLKNVGVTNYSDAVALLQQIKALKKSNNNVNDNKNTTTGNNQDLDFLGSYFN